MNELINELKNECMHGVNGMDEYNLDGGLLISQRVDRIRSAPSHAPFRRHELRIYDV